MKLVSSWKLDCLVRNNYDHGNGIYDAENRTIVKRTTILKVLLAVSVLWFPASFILNPGWYTILLIVNPLSLLVALVPLVIYKATNVREAQNRSDLFFIQTAFFVSWVLMWCFVVNGGDTEESMQSLFSSAFDGIWNSHDLVDLSTPLFGITTIITVMLAIFAMSYGRLGRNRGEAASKGHVFGSILVAINSVYILLPVVISLIVGPSLGDLAVLGGVIGLGNLIYLIIYALRKKKLESREWLGFWVAVLLSLGLIVRSIVGS